MLRRSTRQLAKEIKFGVEARQAMLRGVERIAAAVGATLGPKGRNVAIEQSWSAPKITKDGVTVAKAIDFKDPWENLGAQLVRQVCNKANDLAGDGTTTSALLVQSICTEGFRCIATGTNPMDMKRGMDKAVECILESLHKQSKLIKKQEEIEQVATISANGDTVIGKLVSDAMKKVGPDGVITTQDGKTLQTELELVEGMSIDRGFVSPYFVTDEKNLKVEFDDAFVLVSSKKISSINHILPTLNFIANSGRPILIVADDVEAEALTTMLYNKLQGKLKICCVRAPGFGDNKTACLEDIAISTGAKLVGDEHGANLDAEKFDETILGTAKKVTVTKDQCIMLNGGGDSKLLQERVTILREQIAKETSDYSKEKLQERLGKLTGAVGVIRVGGASEAEVSEKKDRITDALCATRAAAQDGIVAGGGAALLHASKCLDALLTSPNLNAEQKTGINIIKAAVRLPAHRIATNAGLEGAVCVQKVLDESDPQMGYDAQNCKLTNMFEAGIIDPTRVVHVALVHAASVAGLMTTTEAAVCEVKEPKKGAPAAPGGEEY